jgi:preprotein translocase subunit SecE
MPWWQEAIYDELRSTFIPIRRSLIIMSFAIIYSVRLVSLINESV